MCSGAYVLGWWFYFIKFALQRTSELFYLLSFYSVVQLINSVCEKQFSEECRTMCIIFLFRLQEITDRLLPFIPEKRCSDRSSRSQVFFKIVLESLLNKVAGLQACNFIKKRFQHVFSCKICEIYKNTLFLQKPPVADSVLKNVVKFIVKHQWRSSV